MIYKRISRRNFIISTTGVIAGMTFAGAMTGSCNRRPGKKKADILEFDFIGPQIDYFV